MRTSVIFAATLLATGCAQKAPVVAPAPAPGAATAASAAPRKLYLDVHELGSVSAKDVAAAHQKDLAAEGKHGVAFKSYWVDEQKGLVYCLSEAPSADAVVATHREAHGLLPKTILEVKADNMDWTPDPAKKLFMDVHHFGPGKVTAAAVAEAHKKDLAVEGKYGVKYLDYWVDVDSGTVMCLSEAPSAEAAVQVHKEAHGLVPDSIENVVEGR